MFLIYIAQTHSNINLKKKKKLQILEAIVRKN